MSDQNSSDQSDAEANLEASKSQPADHSGGLAPEVVAELNRVVRGILRRELGSAKTPEPVKSEETLTLTQQVKELSRKLQATEQAKAEEKLNAFIFQTLGNHKVQYPDKAAKLIRDKFKVQNEQVVALDEFGDPIDPNKVIEDFLNETPIFKPPRNIGGTGRAGSTGSTSSPRAPAQGTEEDNNPANWGYDQFSKRFGKEKADKLRSMGLIQ